MKYTIKYLKWAMGLDRVDEISYKDHELQTETCKTTKKLVFKDYLWYYEYKKLFYDYLEVNLPIFIESQQLTYCDGQIVNDIKLGGYDKDF